ncbi:MAG: hypothetical protein P8188_07430 [Gemmatimonadota bacterium]
MRLNPLADTTTWRRAAGPVLAAALVGMAACDGPNAFSGPVGLEQDVPRVEITVPRGDSTALPLQDSVFVEARFRDNLGIEEVKFYGETVRGDPSVGTDVRFPRFEVRTVSLGGVRDTTVARFLLPVEDTIKEFTNIIAEGYDRDGNMGADTVRVQLGGPGVRILDLRDGQTVQAGLTLNLSALAKDPEAVTNMDFYLQGSVEQTLRRTFNPPTDSIVVDTTVAIPLEAQGPLTLTVRATNTLGLTGGDGPITLNVIQESQAVDTTAPRLRLNITPPDRVELGDSIPIQITGGDDVAGVGVASVGYTVIATSISGADTVVRQVSEPYVPPRTGSISRQFGIPIIGVDSLALPDTLVYEVTAFMVDGNGNCGTAVDGGGSTFPCDALGTGERIALDQEGTRFTLVVVAGRTVLLPSGGRILDARVDTARRNLFLSNVSRGRVEVFRLDQEQFGTAIGVGSNPWGMAFSRNGDSLWVANSGGTNFSVVDLNAEVEVENQRLLTPDVVLFDIQLDDGTGEYVVYPLPQAGDAAFSDRPQFMAVDSFGNVVYSTTTTATGALGTARKAYYPQPAEQSEIKLFVEHGLTDQSDNYWALAHIDSVGTTVDTIDVGGELTPVPALTLFDHVPGFPNDVITGSAGAGEDPAIAWARLVDAGSDAYLVPGARWNIETVAFSDTTYVDASGDGGWVAIGEGATQELGRVLMYEAQPDQITALSGVIAVSDFLTNASEEVRGVGVNFDGSLVGARGDFAYFFDTGLRPQGQGNIPNAGQAQGIAFHPLHANFRSNTNLTGVYIPDVHVAFVGSGNRTIEVIDTQRGGDPIGRVTIKDVITGPLRAILPFPADNVGRTCSTTTHPSSEIPSGGIGVLKFCPE